MFMKAWKLSARTRASRMLRDVHPLINFTNFLFQGVLKTWIQMILSIWRSTTVRTKSFASSIQKHVI